MMIEDAVNGAGKMFDNQKVSEAVLRRPAPL
jgi:hypothetical protein